MIILRDGETAGQSEGENGFTAEDNSGTDAAAASEESEQIAAADDSRRKWYGYLLQEVNITVFDCGNMNWIRHIGASLTG